MSTQTVSWMALVGLFCLMMAASCDDVTSDDPVPSGEDAAADTGDDAADVRRDVDDDDREVTPDPVWDTIDNECAPDREAVAPEQVEQGSPEMDPDEEPELSWRKAEICPNYPVDEEESGADGYDYATSQDFAYGRFEIDGEERDVLVVVKQGYSSSLLGPVPQALAILDAESGEWIECIELPMEANIIDWSLKVVSGQGIYVPYVTQGGEAEEEFDIPEVFGLAAYRPGEGRLFDKRVDVSEGTGDGDVASQVTSTGQIVVNWKNRRLVSFDHQSGEIYWTIGADAFGIDHELSWLGDPYTLPDDRLIVRVDDRHYEVDRCGEVTEIEGTRDVDYLSTIGEHTVAQTDHSVIVGPGDDDSIEFDVSCEGLVTIDDHHLACTADKESSSGDPIMSLYVMDVESGETEETTVEAPEDLKYARFADVNVALADGAVMVAGHFRFDRERSVRRFFVFDTSDMKRQATFDVEHPEDAVVTSSTTWPLVTPEGKVIVPAWGYLFAFQTGFDGLADAAHPRGGLGGNENRGYVQPTGE